MRRLQFDLSLLIVVWCAVLVVAASGPVAAAGLNLANEPIEGPIPEHVVAAVQARAGTPWGPGGYSKLLELVTQNREDLEAGHISHEQAHARGGTAISGTKRFPVFPILFDNTASAPFTRGALEDQLFTGPWADGTMQEYYEEISYGIFSVDGTVHNWTTVGEDDTYYENGSNGLPPLGRTGELIHDVLDAVDGTVDFSQWDNDGPDGVPNTADDDGYVDFAMFVTPESSGSCGTNANIWSHQWELTEWGAYFETDDASNASGITNTRVNRYFISAGLNCAGTAQIGIGTHCHEFGHAIGLPDFYDTTPFPSADSRGIGHWGLMGSGNKNTYEHPAHMTAFSKYKLGWLTYFNVAQDIEQLCIPPVEEYAAAVRLWTHGSDSVEYFLIENRQQIGFDVDLHAPGLVIYHVDEDVYDANLWMNQVNGDETHKALDVECADANSPGHVVNADDLDSMTNRGDAGDVWCPGTQVDFDGSSVPDTRAYSDAATGVSVRNIDACTGWICADFTVGYAYDADLCIHDCATDNCAEFSGCAGWWGSPDLWIDNDDSGDHDLPAEGLTNHLWFRVQNKSGEILSDVTVNLYYGDPAMGQLWPSMGTLIDSAPIEVMDIDEIVEDYVEFEYPTTSDLVDHYCIGAVVVHPHDPQNSEYPPNDNNVAQVNHQILIERAGGPLAQDCPGPLDKVSRILLHAPQDYAYAVVRLGTPPTFGDYYIPADWNVNFNPGPYELHQGNPIPFYFQVQDNNAQHLDFAHIPLTLWDIQAERAIGGILLQYMIDCVGPKEPDHLTVDWYVPHGDDIGQATVELEWDPVYQDQEGFIEYLKYYEIYRSDDQGNPEALIDRVAVDANRDEPGFQWYDTVPPRCDIVYTYRVRAVDATDTPGSFTSPIDLECAETSVDGTPIPKEWRLAQNSPNPFNPRTEIRFDVPREGRVLVEILDTGGRVVRTLTDQHYAAGAWRLIWDGRKDSGEKAASGVYFYHLSTDERQMTKKMILLQ